MQLARALTWIQSTRSINICASSACSRYQWDARESQPLGWKFPLQLRVEMRRNARLAGGGEDTWQTFIEDCAYAEAEIAKELVDMAGTPWAENYKRLEETRACSFDGRTTGATESRQEGSEAGTTGVCAGGDGTSGARVMVATPSSRGVCAWACSHLRGEVTFQ